MDIGVVPPAYESSSPEEAAVESFLSGLRAELLAAGTLRLIEQEKLVEVMEQIAESHTRDFDPSEAIAVGRLAAADLLIYPTLSASTDAVAAADGFAMTATVEAHARVVRAEDGEILLATHEKDSATKLMTGGGMAACLMEAATRVGTLTGWAVKAGLLEEGRVIEVADQKHIVVNLGSDLGLDKKMKLPVFRASGVLVDQATGRKLLRPEQSVATLTITELGTQTSLCKAKGDDVKVGDQIDLRMIRKKVKSGSGEGLAAAAGVGLAVAMRRLTGGPEREGDTPSPEAGGDPRAPHKRPVEWSDAQVRGDSRWVDTLDGYGPAYVFHPFDRNRPSYLDKVWQSGTKARVRIRFRSGRHDCGPASDFKASLYAIYPDGRSKALFTTIVRYSDGWLKRDCVFESSRGGGPITIRFEAAAGGDNAWCSEWAAVSLFEVRR